MTWGELKTRIASAGITDDTEVGLIDLECYKDEPVESVHVDLYDGELLVRN